MSLSKFGFSVTAATGKKKDEKVIKQKVRKCMRKVLIKHPVLLIWHDECLGLFNLYAISVSRHGESLAEMSGFAKSV